MRKQTFSLILVAALLGFSCSGNEDEPTGPTDTQKTTLLGTYNTPGYAMGVAIAGSYAYVADSAAGLRIVDIGTPTAPASVGVVLLPGPAVAVEVRDTLAFVCAGSAGMYVVNVKTPSSPFWIGSYNTFGEATDISVSGTVAYVADGSQGMRVVNIADPRFPALLGFYMDGTVLGSGVASNGTTVYLASMLYGKMVILNASTPTAPTLEGTIVLNNFPRHVEVAGSYAYVATFTGGVSIVNVSVPASPVLVGTFKESYTTAVGVAYRAPYLYVADGSLGLNIVDVSVPSAPTKVAYWDAGGMPTSVAVSGNIAVVAYGTEGIKVIRNDLATP